MSKSPDAFRSIGEVSSLIGVAPHVLRYWETQFPLFSPVKRKDGRRYYRPDDVRLAAGLCEVLREEGLTIRGAKKLMTADRGAGLRARGARRLQEALPLPAEAMQAANSGATPPVVVVDSAVLTLDPETDQSDSRPKPLRKPVTAQALPLFPELTPPPAPDHQDWLARLVAVNRRLHDWRPGVPLPGRAAELRDLMSSQLHGIRQARDPLQ